MPIPAFPVADQQPLRNISDTALWAAIFRGRETNRPDALFRDPYAERLAGERGARIAKEMRFGNRHAWSWVARTWIIDRIIMEQVAGGADMVINLAAGLDTRPYRMPLPASLAWVEIDLPEMLDYKQDVLRCERAACPVERIPLDLAHLSARREVLEDLGRRAKKALVVSEGLLVYLSAEEAAALATDLSGPSSFRNWVLDMVSPALLRLMRKSMGSQLERAGAALKFAPEEGPDYFRSHGWRAVRVESMLHAAARVKRLPLWMQPLTLLPDRFPSKGKRPWGGVCLFARG